jgi:hypothetical protein
VLDATPFQCGAAFEPAGFAGRGYTAARHRFLQAEVWEAVVADRNVLTRVITVPGVKPTPTLTLVCVRASCTQLSGCTQLPCAAHQLPSAGGVAAVSRMQPYCFYRWLESKRNTVAPSCRAAFIDMLHPCCRQVVTWVHDMRKDIDNVCAYRNQQMMFVEQKSITSHTRRQGSLHTLIFEYTKLRPTSDLC